MIFSTFDLHELEHYLARFCQNIRIVIMRVLRQGVLDGGRNAKSIVLLEPNKIHLFLFRYSRAVGVRDSLF